MEYTKVTLEKVSTIMNKSDFPEWLGSLPAFTRFFIAGLILFGVDEDVIDLAATAPGPQYNQHQFFKMIVGGNKDMLIALNELVLDELILEMEAFHDRRVGTTEEQPGSDPADSSLPGSDTGSGVAVDRSQPE